ncbi:protein YchT [Escherichia coli]
MLLKGVLSARLFNLIYG